MIKKPYQLFCLLLLLSTAQYRLQAQSADLKWSRIFSQSEFEKRLPVLFASDREAVYSYYIRKQNLHILKFDRHTLERADDYEINLTGIKGREKNVERVILSNDKIFVVTQEYDKSADMNYLYCTRLNTRGDVEIENDVIESKSVSKSKYVGNYVYVLSPDENKLLIFHDVAAKRRKAEEKLDFKVYDFKKMEPQWEDEVQLPYRDKDFVANDIQVDNLGRVWLKATYYSSGQVGDFAKLLVYDVDGTNDMDEIEFKSERSLKDGRYFGGWSYTFDNDNNILCFGNYGETRGKRRRKYAVMTGAFVVKLDAKTFEIKDEDYKSLFNNNEDEEEEEDDEENPKSKKKEKKEENPSVTSLILKKAVVSDDYIYLMSEVEYVTEHCTTDPKTRRQTCYYIYHSEEVFVTKIDNKGKIEWTGILNKAQSISYTSYYNSFVTNAATQVKLIYLEAAKNFKKAAGRNINDLPSRSRMRNPKKGVAALAEFNDKGHVEVSELYNVKANGKYIPIPKSSLHLEGSNEILLMTERKKKFRLLKVSFPEA